MPSDVFRPSPARDASPRPRRNAVGRSFALAAFGTLATVGACNSSPQQVADGDDPLAALKVTVESRRYDEQFWKAQRDSPDSAHQQLYTRAVAYCGQKNVAIDGAKPNCRGVMTARALESHGSAATGGMRF